MLVVIKMGVKQVWLWCEGAVVVREWMRLEGIEGCRNVDYVRLWRSSEDYGFKILHMLRTGGV